MRTNSGISLSAIASRKTPAWLTYSAPVLDRLLGIHLLDRIYRRNGLQGLPPFEFVEQSLRALALRVESKPGNLKSSVPSHGPILVVSNHPFGGMEALALAHKLKSVRTDIKFLANTGLQVFRELKPLFIAINPLKISQANLSSIRECEAHLAQGGLLVVFPAGRVSFRPRGGDRIHDADWNRIVGYLAKRISVSLLPVFFSGANSPLFHALGKLWDRSKLLMLPREFLRMRGKTIRFTVGHPIAARVWRHLDIEACTRYARLMTYLLESRTGRASQCAPDSRHWRHSVTRNSSNVKEYFAYMTRAVVNHAMGMILIRPMYNFLSGTTRRARWWARTGWEELTCCGLKERRAYT